MKRNATVAAIPQRLKQQRHPFGAEGQFELFRTHGGHPNAAALTLEFAADDDRDDLLGPADPRGPDEKKPFARKELVLLAMGEVDIKPVSARRPKPV